MLGFKVISEVDTFGRLVETVVAVEVCDWTEEFVVSGTGVIPEVELKLTAVSEMTDTVSLLS